MSPHQEHPDASPPNGHSTAGLDAYLDASLSKRDRQAFERQLSADPNLRTELDLQKRIDAGLRDLMAVPPARTIKRSYLAQAAPSLADTSPKAVPAVSDSAGRAGGGSPWLRRFAVAAMLIAGAYGAWAAWSYFDRPPDEEWKPPEITAAPATLDEIYLARAKNWRAAWRCENDQEFADTFANRFEQPLLMRQPDPSAKIEALGLDYGRAISPSTVYLLANIEDKKALVFIDRLANDQPQVLAQGCGLHLHRRELPPLVLYELSPLPQPQLLELFYLPTAP
jgi:hypothetical protein